MLKASFYKHTLQFKLPAGTSRGVMNEKESWIIKVWNTEQPQTIGTGECGLLKGLSCDNLLNYEETLVDVCENIHSYANSYFHKTLEKYPSIRCGLEMALLDLKNGGKGLYFDSDFTHGNSGIPMNGLIWMGSEAFMQKQIEEKISEGFRCIKMKIGAIDFLKEYQILKNLRSTFPADVLEIRVDANGAFSVNEVLIRLDELSKLELHSIEQPIKAGQWNEMRKLCEVTPLPIALDEELIGIHNISQKEELLQLIKPQYIILKPSLLGGFKASDEWIDLCEKNKTGWWATSALESNIGLNAIAQWVASKKTSMYQGLGTGKLYTNNIESSLHIKDAKLWR
jgi:o-succinylbenzoate synthase